MKRSAFILLSLLFVFSCDTSDMATVRINTGLGSDTRSGTPPANVTGVTVTVRGSGMSTVSQSFPVEQTVVSMSVPAGSDREIVVDASIDPADPGFLLSYRGRVVTDLVAGANIIVVPMGAGDTKLIIPDPETWDGSDSRLIQITDFTTQNWQEINAGNVSVSTFRPWDFDFDNEGKLYIANKGYSTGDGVVFRITDFTSINEEMIVNTGGAEILNIAVDRNNKLLYHSNGGTNLLVTDLTGTLPDSSGTTINVTSLVTNICALAVDDEGMLYIADYGVINTADDKIVKINPASPSIALATYTSNLDFQFNSMGGNHYLADIVYSSGYLYVANEDGPDGHMLLQLDKNLNFIAGYGTREPTFPQSDPLAPLLYNPHHFAGVRSDGLYLIDETFESGSDNYDKLFHISNMNGDGWEVLDPGSNSFEFYYNC